MAQSWRSCRRGPKQLLPRLITVCSRAAWSRCTIAYEALWLPFPFRLFFCATMHGAQSDRDCTLLETYSGVRGIHWIYQEERGAVGSFTGHLLCAKQGGNKVQKHWSTCICTLPIAHFNTYKFFIFCSRDFQHSLQTCKHHYSCIA